MKIKKPDSKEAVKSLFELLSNLRDRVEICSKMKHSTATILYISTYTLNVNVAFNGVSLLNLISDIIRCNPNSVICLFRTVSPIYFSGHALHRHGRMLRELENIGCYVRDFDPKREEFINHAKFVIAMHYCFDERVRYYGHYYGSTNLTISGLTNIGFLKLRGRPLRQIMGNYEEYKYLSFRSGYFYEYAGYSQSIIKDVEETLEWYLIKTNKDRVIERTRDYLDWIRTLVRALDEVVRGTTMGELFKAYLCSSIAIYMVMSFIGSLPGKKLTINIIEKTRSLARDIMLETILELDQILLNDEALEQGGEKLLESLGFSKRKLLDGISDRIKLLQTISNDLEDYVKAIVKLEPFLDKHEEKIYKRIKEYTNIQLDCLKKLRSQLSKYP